MKGIYFLDKTIPAKSYYSANIQNISYLLFL